MSLVEYYDPDGLFPLLSSQLHARLPLRNLHWKSATRPLRSIPTLQLQFVPANSQNERAAGPSQNDSADSVGRPSLAEGDRRRRHQIPGMEQTPFLKVYFLRCDDKDVYKSTKRKILRDWLKENVPDAKSSRTARQGESHDAFEWLIVHVPLPNTIAAAQPRLSKPQAGTDSDGAKQRPVSGSQWPGKGSRTVFERICSDFNSSSKSAPDRVAQIRLQRDAVLQRLSAGPSNPFQESVQERENAWSDLTSKLKSLILSAFNDRVTQYEEDIREREVQRSLPGWNFCTFFILKEGLTKAFESVGLLEDALLVYDELSIGLDSIVRHQIGDGNRHGSPALLPFASDFSKRLQQVLDVTSVHQISWKNVHRQVQKPLSVENKDYRFLIVSNNISLYDFRCYIFGAQFAILMQLSRITTDTNSDGAPKQNGSNAISGSHNAARLADACQRAVQFVTSVARIMRDELWLSYNTLSSSDGAGNSNAETIIDNLVSSWTYSVLQQILDETSSSSVPSPKGLRAAQNRKPLMRQSSFPVRQSSLAASHKAHDDIRRNDDDEELYLEVENVQLFQSLKDPNAVTAAGQRAELYLLQSRILGILQRQGEWGFANDVTPSDEQSTEFTKEHVSDKAESQRMLAAIDNIQLRAAMADFKDFALLYELISDHAAWFYSIGGRKLSAEKVLYDLAAIKFKNSEYSKALTYLAMILPDYESQRWTSVESKILTMYAVCLRETQQYEELVRITSVMLKQSANERRTLYKRGDPRNGHVPTRDDPLGGSLKDGLFSQLLGSATHLTTGQTMLLETYFQIQEVGQQIEHFDDRDGFRVRLTIRQLLADHIKVDSIKFRLVEASKSHASEIWLQSQEGIEFGTEPDLVSLHSNTTTFGEFLIDKLIIQVGKLSFVHEFVLENNSQPTRLRRRSSVAQTLVKGPRVYCFPHAGSLQARIEESPTVNVDKRRTLEVVIDSGANDILQGEVHLQPLIEGITIFADELEVISGNTSIAPKEESGHIHFRAISPHQQFTLRLPYSTQSTLPNITFQLEVRYKTEHGDFTHITRQTIQDVIPIDKNVKSVQIFTANAIISKFQLQTAIAVPIHILGAQLEKSELFDVEAPFAQSPIQTLFPEQTLPLMFKLLPRESPNNDASTSTPTHRTLNLTLTYTSLPSTILSQILTTLTTSLKGSPLASISHLILHLVKTYIPTRLTPEAYQKAALTDEIDLPPFTTMNWHNMIRSLPKTMREDMQMWLEAWCADYSPFKLVPPDSPTLGSESEDQTQYGHEHEQAYGRMERTHTLIFPIKIPTLQYLHTTSLTLSSNSNNPNSTSVTHQQITTLDQPITAQIRTSYTSRWAAAPPSSSVPQKFTLNITASSSDWLIAGPSRFPFEAGEGEEKVWEVTVIPGRVGYLTFPGVSVEVEGGGGDDVTGTVTGGGGMSDVRGGGADGGEVDAGDDEGDGMSGRGRECVTNYVSRGVRVLVVEGKK